MGSKSLYKWLTARSRELDEIERAHSAVGGRGPGRRWATRQLNNAYTLILSSQFQGFARDLHSEAVDLLVASISPSSLRRMLDSEFTFGRRLDQGNPTPGNIGSDFGRISPLFWSRVDADDERNRARRNSLEQLVKWRNAIAHQDIDPAILIPSSVRLETVRTWRRACNGLARSFDRVLQSHLETLLGSVPW